MQSRCHQRSNRPRRTEPTRLPELGGQTIETEQQDVRVMVREECRDPRMFAGRKADDDVGRRRVKMLLERGEQG